jgi:hypothetical protein
MLDISYVGPHAEARTTPTHSAPSPRSLHIGEVARRLGVTPQHLRILEREGRIPLARRDFNGRVYTEFDIALLRSMGVGSRPSKLKRVVEVLRANG